jgi:hypothetical protein
MCPAELPCATGTSDFGTLFGSEHQGNLKRAIGLVIEQPIDDFGKDRRLDEPHDASYANDAWLKMLRATCAG